MSTEIEPGEHAAGAGSTSTQLAGTTAEREAARKRLQRRNKFHGDLVAYVVINAFLVVIWIVSGSGYFWPGWILGGWGIFLLLDAWNVYVRRPITEADIDRELRRQS